MSFSLGETGTVQRMTTQRIAGGTVHKLPADIRKAIESNAAAKSLWTDITPLARNEWICWVTSAKKEETRKRRIEVGIDKLRGGMRRPCCWPAALLSAFGVRGQNRASASKRTRQTLCWWIGELGRILRL
jgi:hypothetical protein